MEQLNRTLGLQDPYQGTVKRKSGLDTPAVYTLSDPGHLGMLHTGVLQDATKKIMVLHRHALETEHV